MAFSQLKVLQARHEEVRTLLPQTTYDLTSNPLAQFVVKDNIRLKQFSPEEAAGYGVALAFWLQIAHNHGEVVISEFLERARLLQQPSDQELARILEELTGEDIWSKLKQMDLQEVLQTLSQEQGR